MASKVQNILEEYRDKIVSQLKDRIRQRGLVASKGLLNSIRGEVSQTGITIFSTEYASFVESGRGPGKPPPVSKILEWVQDKDLQPRYKKYERHRDIAWMIAMAIAKNGTIERFGYLGGDFVDYVSRNIIESLTKDIEQSYLDDLNKELDGSQ
tara:strand:+ start:1808 stop:2266 length:459 start_codon:yes stop_codon:yes gene_type:complete